MRKWLAPLSRDATLLADFKAHLGEYYRQTLETMIHPDANVEFQRGMCAGIKLVEQIVTMNINEEAQRARRPTAA